MGLNRLKSVLTSLIAAIMIQPAGIFPVGFERHRSETRTDVYFAKDARDKGTLLGQGHSVTQIPRDGGCVFVSDDGRILGFDSSGNMILDYSKLGYRSIGRPAVDANGNFVLAEFVGEEESEIWRIPMKGKGPAAMLSSINKGQGNANPAFEMDSGSFWMNMGGTWLIYDLRSSQTTSVDVKVLLDGLPKGSRVSEIRPSPTMPKQVAVGIIVAGTEEMRWVMVWDRNTGLVSRVSPAGANCDSVDWSRDGRYVLFKAAEIESKRVTLQSARPNGGEPAIIAVVKDAGT